MSHIGSNIYNFCKNNKNYILLFLAIHLLMVSFFLLTSIGTEKYRLLLQIRRYLPCALSVTIALYFWNLLQRNLLPPTHTLMCRLKLVFCI